MLRVLAALCVMAMMQSCGVDAKTRAPQVSSDAWGFLRVDGFTVTMYDTRMTFESVCVAAISQQSGDMLFAMVPAEITSRESERELRGLVIGRVADPRWKLRRTLGAITLGFDRSSYRVEGAEYNRQSVVFMIEAQHTPSTALEVMAGVGAERLSLMDHQQQPLASFSLAGFAPALDQLLQCAGMRAGPTDPAP